MSPDAVKWAKSPEHREKIRLSLIGNLNALKTGRYAKRSPPAATCYACPLASRCPRYRPGGACVFIWERLEKMEKRTKRLLGGQS